MKRLISYFVVAILLQLLAASCGKIDVSILDKSISSFEITGLNGVKVDLNFKLANNGRAIEVEDINGDIKWKGNPVGKIDVMPFKIEGKSTYWQKISCQLTIDRNMNLLMLVKMLREKDYSTFSADIRAVCKIGAVKKKIERKNIAPWSSLSVAE